jgi:hypothetical protein
MTQVPSVQGYEFAIHRNALVLMHDKANMNMVKLIGVVYAVAGVARLAHINQIHGLPPDEQWN